MNTAHEELPPEEDTGSNLRTAILHHLVTTTLIIATLSFAIWGYFNFRAGDFFYEPTDEDESRTMQRFLVASQLQRFEFATQAFEAIHNAPPQSMDDLVAEGLILESDLTYPSPKINYSMRIEDDHAVVSADSSGTKTLAAPTDEPTPKPSKNKGKKAKKRKAPKANTTK